MKRLRVLVLSFLPPARGGIATWAGILRDRSAYAPCQFSFESIAGTRIDDRASVRVKLGEAAGVVGRLIHHLVHRRPDVVHLNCCLSPRGLWRDLLVAALVRAWRIPLAVHHRGSLPDVVGRLPAPSRIALRGLMRLAAVNIGLTRASESLLKRHCGSERTAYLPNFIEDELPHRTAGIVEGRETQARARAISVGRLSLDKGTLDVLAAARALPDVDFVLVGDVLEDVRDAISRAPANVVALGHSTREQVLDDLAAGDLFVFPSHREGFPNAVLEAMAVGLPVVSTRVGAVTDMIEDGCGGYLVAPGDAAALAQAVDRLAGDPRLARRMGANNRRVCLERFTHSAVVARLSAIYDRLACAQAARETARISLAAPRAPAAAFSTRRSKEDP